LEKDRVVYGQIEITVNFTTFLRSWTTQFVFLCGLSVISALSASLR